MNTPPPMPPSFQMMRDAEHLKLLSVFHYVLGGLSMIGVLLGVLYAFIGKMMVDVFAKMPPPTGSTTTGPVMPKEIMWIFVVYGAIICLVCLTSAVGHCLAGRYMSQRKNRTFCLVIAGASCLFVPLGTILGVFSILVLVRPTVAALFDGQEGLTAPRF